jgi:3-hydroxymyristoyl/3-hydroxydecanoyl-(acyl carrier protein) dehydratase
MAIQKPERTLMFPPDAPCLAGHFPDKPVVPAAAILSELIPWAEKQLGRPISGVRSARFRRPLVPGLSWHTVLEEPDGDEVTLICREDGQVAVTARLSLGSR